MASPRARFTQSEITRVLRAMKSANFDGVLEIRLDGSLLVRAASNAPGPEAESELERWKRARASGDGTAPDTKRVRIKL